MKREVIAKNIFRLRKLAGLNQKQAAEKSGLSRPAFAAIEKGKADPRSDTLHRIAQALDVSIKDLFTEMPELKSVRFRMNKLTEQKKKLREQEIINIAQWLKNYNYLENELNCRMHCKLLNLRIKDPVKLASGVRKELNIDQDEPIADITDIINQAGIKIHLSDLPIDNFFGLCIGAEDGGPAISVNAAKNISIERQIFTAAHELAHLLLHRESFKGELLEDDEKEEKEADQFASYFLMPAKSFNREVNLNKGLHWVDMVLNVKHYFKVSYKTVLMRLRDTGMADDSIYKNFAIEYKKKYARSLKDHFEPAALREPDGPAHAVMTENRLYNLVREATEKEIISLNRAAEILSKSNPEMRELANSWEEIHWKEVKK